MERGTLEVHADERATDEDGDDRDVAREVMPGPGVWAAALAVGLAAAGSRWGRRRG